MTTNNSLNYPNVASGQTLIGTASNTVVSNGLTAGTGISVVGGSGTITLNTLTGGFAWNNITGTSATLVAQNAYVANNAGLVTFTLPSTGSLGDTILIYGLGSGGWTVTLNSGQLIQFGSVATTTTTGSVSSTNQYDTITLVCIATNTNWSVRGAVGNLTIV